MAQRYGPRIVTDSLVLCLDAHDAKSYAGEPTTNVVTYTDLNIGWSKGYQSNIAYNEIDPPAGITSQVVGHTRGNNSGYWYSYGDYAPQVPNTVYTVSMYVKTLDSNFKINFYTADNSETGRFWSSHISVPNDGEWHRVVWDSFTNPSNSQSDSLSFNFTYGGAINETSTRTWFCAPQMEAKSYATPFVAGSRSATNGWVDRSGNSNHGTLVNGTDTGVSHYRDGQVIMPVANSYLDFDGSNDYISIPQFDFTSTHSLEWWFNTDNLTEKYTGGYAGHMLCWGHSPSERIQLRTNGGIRIYIHDSSTGASFDTSNFNVTAGEWTHITATLDWVNKSVKFYQNGVLKDTISFSSLGSWNYTGASNPYDYIDFGRNVNNNNIFFDGKLASIKIYNKVLTAAEVLSNYNATKGRFS